MFVCARSKPMVVPCSWDCPSMSLSPCGVLYTVQMSIESVSNALDIAGQVAFLGLWVWFIWIVGGYIRSGDALPIRYAARWSASRFSTQIACGFLALAGAQTVLTSLSWGWRGALALVLGLIGGVVVLPRLLFRPRPKTELWEWKPELTLPEMASPE